MNFKDSGQDGQNGLLPGEQVLWSGRPDPGIWFAPADRLGVPLGLIGLAFLLFWEHAVLTAHTTSGGRRYPVLFAIWGLIILLVVLWVTFGQMVTRRRRLSRTRYLVTNLRLQTRVGVRTVEMRAAQPTAYWTHNNSHVTVLWLSKAPRKMPQSLGLLYAKPTMSRKNALVFANVADGQSLLRVVTG